MLPPREAGYLLDILLAAKAAQSYLKDLSFEQFLEDPKSQDAVIRRFEIIGEASRRISSTVREQLTQFPWDKMIGMRNAVIHSYDDVDFDVIWSTVQGDLPGLITDLEKIVPKDPEA